MCSKCLSTPDGYPYPDPAWLRELERSYYSPEAKRPYHPLSTQPSYLSSPDTFAIGGYRRATSVLPFGSFLPPPGLARLSGGPVPHMPGYFTNIQAAKEALQRALSQIGTSRGRVKTDLRVGLRDLGIAEREGREDYTGETIERGVYHSGIRLQGLDKITKAYDRRERDLHRAVRERLADLARAAGDAQSSYRQSILGIKGQDILYRSQLPNVPVPTKTQLYNVGMQASKRLNIPASWISSPALWNLIARESGGNPNAQNPNSTAYGIFQFLDSTWKGTGYQKTADPYVQFLAGLTYIKRRYGSPQNAWNFWQKHHWY